MMNKMRAALQLVRYFGIGWLIFRIVYAVKMRMGWYRLRLPAYSWEDRPLGWWLRPEIPAEPDAYAAWREQHRRPFFFDTLPTVPPASPVLLAEADALVRGEWTYFAHERQAVGMPPHWHRNPFTGQVAPSDRHWSQISDFDSGDIKFIWEASRFSGVFALVRAYAATRRPEYARAFWFLVNDWAVNNPPQLGPNWKCGQEATFRVMAWCFGLYAFKDAASPAQLAQLVSLIAAHGDRIEGNIAYAVSQNNNHGISEAVGLWTIGTLFPELKQAKQWAEKGKRIFEREMRRQVYDDGSYAQHSPNYQRVMLHDAIWALRLGELNGDRFPNAVYAKVEKSARFLYQLLDPVTGHVPNHGANDSALILPLNDCDPRDFRPVIQAAYYLRHQRRLFDSADDDLRWLFGADALNAPVDHETMRQEALSAKVGGYYTLRGRESWLMVRCARYRARPHHADQLHVDMWWRGLNLACDAGTYLYNGETPWQNGLATTAVHNTVMIDEHDQMRKYNRFLWLDWSVGKVHRQDATYWEGSHNGYLRLVPPAAHWRAVRLLNDVWLIADEIVSDDERTARLHWLLPAFPYTQHDHHIELDTPHGSYFIFASQPFDIVRADPNGVRGWRSQYYGQREPALSLSAAVRVSTTAHFWTIFAPRLVKVEPTNDGGLMLDGQHIRWGERSLIEVDAQ